MSNRVVNPVLPGFYPDPTICAANGEFYLMTASLSYFPGLPVFKSKDCVKWNQIENAINRAEQLDFSWSGVTKGIYSPALRYHDGIFYCLFTLKDKNVNYMITAREPAGLWSNPVEIQDAEGTDPSLFFDDDGKCYYTGARKVSEKSAGKEEWEIYLCEFDLQKVRLTGEKKSIWKGAAKNPDFVSVPHIFKNNGKYYLITSEEKEYDSCICAARADSLYGEWTGKTSNPIFTQRHLGKNAGIVKVSHADIFQDNDKRWWMVCVASRPYGLNSQRYSNIGRETFMVPVKWEDEWPVVSWETGKIENAYSITGHVVLRGLEDVEALIVPAIDDFNKNNLDYFWLSLRRRNYDYINLTENSGCLRIYGGQNLESYGDVNIIARRQTGFSYEASTKMTAHFSNDEDAAGIILIQNENFNYRLQLKRRGKVIIIQLIKSASWKNEELNQVIAEEVIDGGKSEIAYVLRVVEEKQALRFEYGPDERCLNVLADNIDATILSGQETGGLTGTLVGMFAVSGEDYKSRKFYADFDWFRYENTTRDWVS